MVFDNPQEEQDLHDKKWKENIEEQEALRREIFDVFYELLPYLWW